MKTFTQFNSDGWVGPYTILYPPRNSENVVSIRTGNFENISGDQIKVGYSYILRIEDGKIIETGMSCVDLVVLVKTEIGFKVLLIKRGRYPFIGSWAIPGGNIDEGETKNNAGVRELKEETNLVIDPGHFYYVGAFDKEFRDPRNKNCVSHAFTIVLDEIPPVKAGDDATECGWFDVSPDGDIEVEMAFDHRDIIKEAINKIK